MDIVGYKFFFFFFVFFGLSCSKEVEGYTWEKPIIHGLIVLF